FSLRPHLADWSDRFRVEDRTFQQTRNATRRLIAVMWDWVRRATAAVRPVAINPLIARQLAVQAAEFASRPGRRWTADSVIFSLGKDRGASHRGLSLVGSKKPMERRERDLGCGTDVTERERA